ncbi:MAG: CDP-archaeol synthase [Candidatus Woesearchaeota archaeon]
MDNIWLLLLKSAYFLIPAYFANMAPPLAKKLKIFECLARPVDHNKVLRDGRALFGRNKTYRGFLVGLIGGVLGAYLQMLLFNIPFFSSISVDGINYSSHAVILLIGVLMGVGAITGDLIESFFKRRLNIGSGETFVPWDQTDLVIGAYLFMLPFVYIFKVAISWQLFLCSILTTFFLHIIANHLAFYLNIRKEKW